MISLPAAKVQNAFFWTAAGILACLAFVSSSRTLHIEMVPVTFPRETVFFTLSALAICFSVLRGGGALAGHKRVAFYLLAALLGWSIVATLWAVNVPGHSRRLIELTFFCGWAFALSTLVAEPKKAKMLTLILGFSGGVVGVAVAGGLLAFNTPLGTWPFGNPNAAGMFCAFAAVINTGLFLKSVREQKPSDPQVIISLACTVMALSGLLAAWSKGAFLGLIVGEAVIAWRFFPDKRKWVAAAGVAILALCIGAYILNPWRQESLSESTSDFRIQAYKATAKQISDAPVGGRGLGSFYAYFPQYALPAMSGHPKMGDTVFHAHSNLLETGTELGIVGMLLFVAFTVYIGVLPLVKKQPVDDKRAKLEGIWLAGFLMISTHALVAVHFYWTETVLYYWTAAGVLLALGRKEKPVEEVKRGLAFLAVAAVALAGLWYVGVYQEMLGRTYVASREKNLKKVRKLDKKYSRLMRTRKTNTREFQKVQVNRYILYSRIIAALNRELEFVHVARMRSDTYYQLGSAYYNIGGIFLDPSVPVESFHLLGTTPMRKKRYGGALHFFRLVIKDAPGYVNTDYFIGRACEGIRQSEGPRIHTPQQLKKYEEEGVAALERYLGANVRSKMSGEAALFLAGIYSRLGKLQEGIALINRHLKFKPDSLQKTSLERLRNSLVNRLARQKKPRGKK